MKSNRFISLVLFICLFVLIAVPCSGQENDQEKETVKTDIAVENAVICRDVVDREPVGAGDVFSTDLTKLMCFTRITGLKENTEILHNWYFGDKLVAGIPLHVGSTNWRTYSSKKITPTDSGEWKVEILSQDETLLKRIYFVIE